jgi:hypothetical protein
MSVKIAPKERDAAVQALRAGVVPRLGIRHVQVGRAHEVEETVRDMSRIADGGSAVRFVIGDYGSGKTFFLTLARTIAAERKLVVMHADLSPDRRIHATGGQARTLCAELVMSMSTRTKPDGGALASVVERFVSNVRTDALARGCKVEDAIRERLEVVRDLVSGFDFAEVIVCYWRGFEEGDEQLKGAALRWLRAEYTLKTEAREALGVRTIIDDAGVYDHLKAIARLVRLAGYDGTLVVLDEMVNLYKLTNSQARNANYEQVLRIVNDVLQGSAERIGFYFGGTPEFLLDSRRGLYSYEALRSRLAENAFARDGLVDLSGPVIRLQSLTPEELYVLLDKLRLLWAAGDANQLPVPDAALGAFLEHCSKKIGAAYFRTPRNTIRAFFDLLAVLDQNPGTEWGALLGRIEVAPDAPLSTPDIEDLEASNVTAAARPMSNGSDEAGLATFRI